MGIGVVRCLPNELVFTFCGFLRLCQFLVKIHQEMRALECMQTDTRTEANWFYNLYAIATFDLDTLFAGLH